MFGTYFATIMLLRRKTIVFSECHAEGGGLYACEGYGKFEKYILSKKFLFTRSMQYFPMLMEKIHFLSRRFFVPNFRFLYEVP